MQAQTLPQQAPDAAATPPAPPSPPVIRISGAGEPVIEIAVPTSRADIQALEQRRSQISRQLLSANDRRGELAKDLRNVHPDARAGLQTRILQLDERIMQLEGELEAIGRTLRGPEAARVMAGTVPPLSSADEEEAFGFGLAAGIGIAMAIGWIRRRRRQHREEARALRGVDPGQIARLEQAVDAIAIEVERIAEGQRFTTKLMAEQAGARVPRDY